MRLLESTGYRTLALAGSEPFATMAGKIFKLIGAAPEPRKHALQGVEVEGLLVQQDEGGRRVLFTRQQMDLKQKWVMGPWCVAR